MSENELKLKVFAALENGKADYRSPSSIAEQIGVTVDEVIFVIKTWSDKIVEGPFLSKNNESTYCLRCKKSEWSRVYDFFVCAR